MAAFTYLAIDNQGKTKKGIMEADSARLVRQQLRELNLTPLEVNAIAEKKTKRTPWFRRIPLNELALIIRQIATLLEAGMPVEEALQGVIEQTDKPKLKAIMTGVRSRVLEGHSLAYAMGQFPQAFPELYCATVAAGEQTGKLYVVLSRLADYAEQQQAMRHKISQALIYPILMTLVSLAIVTFLLTYVVPKIIQVFTNTGQVLPAATLMLIGFSNFMIHYGLYLLIVIVLLFMVFFRALRNPKFKFSWHKLLLKIPLLGYAIRTINTARYARTFGILFAAGVSVLEAMSVSAKLITNKPMQEAINAASKRVHEGANINHALKQTGFFSPMSIHLIANGEKSGRLEQMLEYAANNQDRDVVRLLDTLLSLLEPLIILVMGAIVLFIVLAVLLPIFQLDQFTG